MKTIYAADDEKEIRDILSMFLKSEGYEVVLFENGDSLYEAYKRKSCDLIILDIMMPGHDGLFVCNEIRSMSKVPIIILSAKDSDLDYISGLTLGSDDYITKPFRPSVLIAKIKAIFRRIELEKKEDTYKINLNYTDDISYGDLRYSEKKHILYCKDKEVKLTSTEMRFVKFMMQHSDEALSKEDVLNHIWGINADIETRVADETNRRVRKKLTKVRSNVYIQTVWGYGFKLTEKGDLDDN